jgi:signal transduction histidine kinase
VGSRSAAFAGATCITATAAGGSVTVQTRENAGQPRRAAGSGIGLTIARNIARAHGGEVTAASAGRGGGATFTLTLPVRSG